MGRILLAFRAIPLHALPISLSTAVFRARAPLAPAPSFCPCTSTCTLSPTGWEGGAGRGQASAGKGKGAKGGQGKGFPDAPWSTSQAKGSGGWYGADSWWSGDWYGGGWYGGGRADTWSGTQSTAKGGGWGGKAGKGWGSKGKGAKGGKGGKGKAKSDAKPGPDTEPEEMVYTDDPIWETWPDNRPREESRSPEEEVRFRPRGSISQEVSGSGTESAATGPPARIVTVRASSRDPPAVPKARPAAKAAALPASVETRVTQGMHTARDVGSGPSAFTGSIAQAMEDNRALRGRASGSGTQGTASRRAGSGSGTQGATTRRSGTGSGTQSTATGGTDRPLTMEQAVQRQGLSQAAQARISLGKAGITQFATLSTPTVTPEQRAAVETQTNVIMTQASQEAQSWLGRPWMQRRSCKRRSLRSVVRKVLRAHLPAGGSV